MSNEFDPLEMALRSQEEGWKRQERESREQYQLADEKRYRDALGLAGGGGAGSTFGWADLRNLLVGCLLIVVIIFVAASILGWAIATFVVK